MPRSTPRDYPGSILPDEQDLARDPLLIFLHEKPPFDPDRDAALFDELVKRYSGVADEYVAKCRQKDSLLGAELSNSLAGTVSLDFDTLAWGSREDELVSIVVYLFEHFDLLEECSIDKEQLRHFITVLGQEYHLLSYHSFLHALDVTQFCGYLLVNGGLAEHLEPFDITCLLLSALGHDLGHPGGNHQFIGSIHARSGKEIVGDTLEECHLKLLFDLLMDRETGIAVPWDSKHQSQFKQMSAAAVAATDMNNHLVALAHFDKTFRHIPPQKYGTPAWRRFLVQLAIKCADVSNIVRPLQISQKWTHALASEMDNCDHCTLSLNSTRIRHTQESFINFIAKPLFAALYITLPNTGDCLWNLAQNLDSWEKWKFPI